MTMDTEAMAQLLQILIDPLTYAPFNQHLQVLTGLVTICWLAAMWSGNYSQVDRIWSIAPVVYAWLFTVLFSPIFNGDGADLGGKLNSIALSMACLTTLWGLRLTFNLWRKGGYESGAEDYRFAVLRKQITHPVAWQLFAFGFIALFQNILLLLLVLPIYACVTSNSTVIETSDLLISILFQILLLVETLADSQQLEFQTQKYAIPENKRQGIYKVGFLQDGLFAYSRHPSYFCEIMMWWTMYAFTISRLGWLNYTIVGPFLLTLLFMGSLKFTEEISASKYPEYAQYQRTTSALIPWFKSKAPTKAAPVSPKKKASPKKRK